MPAASASRACSKSSNSGSVCDLPNVRNSDIELRGDVTQSRRRALWRSKGGARANSPLEKKATKATPVADVVLMWRSPNGSQFAILSRFRDRDGSGLLTQRKKRRRGFGFFHPRSCPARGWQNKPLESSWKPRIVGIKNPTGKKAASSSPASQLTVEPPSRRNSAPRTRPPPPSSER